MNNMLMDLNDKISNLNLATKVTQSSVFNAVTFSCEQCDYVTRNSQDLNKHMHSTHNHNQLFQCNACTYKGIHQRDLKRHQNYKHGIPFTCEKCDSTFPTKSHLQEHIREGHRSSRTFYRKTMHSSTSKIHTRENNNRDIHRTKTQPEQVLQSQQNKREHDVQHTSPLYECKEACNLIQKCFKEKDAFELHMNYFHGQNHQ